MNDFIILSCYFFYNKNVLQTGAEKKSATAEYSDHSLNVKI